MPCPGEPRLQEGLGGWAAGSGRRGQEQLPWPSMPQVVPNALELQGAGSCRAAGQPESANGAAGGPTWHPCSLARARHLHLCLLPKTSRCPSGAQFPNWPVCVPASATCWSFWGWARHTLKGWRPPAVHPVKEDQYITVLSLQKLKMSTWICAGHGWVLRVTGKGGKD